MILLFSGTILGVAQLCNKKTGPCFSTFDEDVATAFGIYCCISINHVSINHVTSQFWKIIHS